MHIYIQRQNQQVNRRYIKITYLFYGPGACTGQGLQEAGLFEEGKEWYWGPGFLYKMSPKPRGDDRITVCELTLLNLGEACVDVFGEGATDGDACHSVGWVSKVLKVGFGVDIPRKEAG